MTGLKRYSIKFHVYSILFYKNSDENRHEKRTTAPTIQNKEKCGFFFESAFFDLKIEILVYDFMLDSRSFYPLLWCNRLSWCFQCTVNTTSLVKVLSLKHSFGWTEMRFSSKANCAFDEFDMKRVNLNLSKVVSITFISISLDFASNMIHGWFSDILYLLSFDVCLLFKKMIQSA